MSGVYFDHLLTYEKECQLLLDPCLGPARISQEKHESRANRLSQPVSISSLTLFRSKISRQSIHLSCFQASIKFKTSRTLLQNLFPPNSTSYRFKSPGTVAYASFSQTTLNKMDWLGGSGYKHIGLYIHGVEYVKKNGDIISGTCELQSLFQVKFKIPYAFQQICHSSLKT